MSHSQNGAGSGKAPKKAIEKIYQKKSQLEHILLRPDSYIGSVEYTKENMWVYDKERNKMVQRELNFVPGLYKIFDEILVNAADNKQRDKHMSTIRIDINQEENTISIFNNGEGIPVEMHKEEKMYVPTMIFGHLLTSSNYDDEEEKVTGGRNGYGAKLCNIFSTKFTVETANRKSKRSFKQTWGSNMSKASEPKLNSAYSGEDYTKVTFSPDLTKFKMEKLDDDIVALMSRRAYDVAASSKGIAVFLNGDKLPIKTFKDYIDLYTRDSADDSNQPLKIVYEQANERWEVAITMSDKGYQQVSFVNSIATTKGGRHVDYITDMIVKQLIDVLKKKNKGGINIKPFQVKNHMWVFVNCLIVNPTFDSQTKENMTLQSKSFGSKVTLTEKFINNVSKSGIVESVLSWAKFKAQVDLNKKSGGKATKIKGIPKLEDANDAGTKNSLNCTLILTEGDSAKTLAVSGLSVVGRDTYGVFPLRGKLLNVREATHKQLLENAEINNLIKILGLQYKKKYLTLDDLKTLRYGKCMIMTDQDQDGSHIKGLLINFIHSNWPELLRLPFLEEFITPIVKATKKNEELSFFSLPEFEEWRNETPNSHTYNVKYYKGLGTSTSKEAKEYFQNMDRHRVLFKYSGQSDDDAIVMAFSKKCIEQRKDWLTAHMTEVKRRKLVGLPERYLYTKTTKAVSYEEFVNLELVLFSNSDNERSIPCMVDGLKPGQRKVMFTCFKRNDKREVKVAQLAGSVAEMSAYHHGEVSLTGTIVNLAQNYVGSNNINLLVPSGQFGTRLCGGKDSASPRYIFTYMSPLTRFIFHPSDDPLLDYQVDDNQRIEPVWYIPVIPMILINGAEGIGTGWSTKIPNHSPREVIANLRRMIQGEEPVPMNPYYKNFQGTISKFSHHRYMCSGRISILDNNKVEISELPVGTWTQTYKENVLEGLLHGSDKDKATNQKGILTDYKEYNTDTTVRFVVSFAPGEFEKLYAEDGGFYRVFKLTSMVNTSCMHAFDFANYLRRYETSVELLQEFYTLRLEYYVKRKAYLEGQLGAEAELMTMKARFIMEKCDGTLTVENKKRKTMIDELIKRGYTPDPVKEWKRRVAINQAEEDEDKPDDEEEEEEDVKPGKSKKPAKDVDPEKAFQRLTDVKKFDYLLGMSMWMLTDEKKNELLKQRDHRLSELRILKAKTEKTLWKEDLDALSKKLDEVEEKERLDDEQFLKKQAKNAAAKKAAGGGRGAKKTFGKGDDTKPSPDGIELEFKITAEILKKYEKEGQPKKEKVKKEKGVTAKVGGGDGVDDPVDEFDALVEGGAPKVKKEPVKREPKVKKEPKPKGEKKSDGMKQTKLKFPKKKKGGSSDEDDAIDLSSGSDMDFSASVAPREDRPGRRSASKKVVNYKALLDDEDEKAFSSDDEPELFDNNKAEESFVQEILDDDESSAEEAPAKPAPKRKLAPPATPESKKRLHGLVDSDTSENSPIKKRPAAKKKAKYAESDDEDDDDSDFELE